MVDVTNPNPAPSGLALAALGVAGVGEESKLAGKSLDLNGDGKITADEVKEALDAVKKDSRDGTPGQPRLRLVPGGGGANEVPAELVSAEKNGAKQEERGAPSLDVSFPPYYSRPEEAVRKGLALTGAMPGLNPEDLTIFMMKIETMRELAAERSAELLRSKGLSGVTLPSLQGLAA